MVRAVAPEFHLLCLSLRRPENPAEIELLRRAIAAATDWAAVVEGAIRHRVAPLVLHSLQECAPANVPADVIDTLRERTAAAAGRSLVQVGETVRLVRAFGRAGVRVLVLKGEVLSTQIYANQCLRMARDIDLLADPDRFVEAEATLAGAGYRRLGKETSPGQRAVYQSMIKEVEYFHPELRTVVELHHRLTDNPSLLPSDFDQLWSEREEVRIGDFAVPTLPRPHLALYLCAHGANHAWQRLRWLADFAAELRHSQNIDATLAAASRAGLEAATLHALSLAHDWLGLPVAERHLAAARASPQVRRLDRILARIYGGDAWHRALPNGVGAPGLWPRLYALMLKANTRYWANQAKRAWFAPADWEVVRLPDSMLWLYHVVRPVGWLLRRTGVARRLD